MKYCKDCKHYIPEAVGGLYLPSPIPGGWRDAARDMVTGEPEKARGQREYQGKCGRDARMFEQKPEDATSVRKSWRSLLRVL